MLKLLLAPLAMSRPSTVVSSGYTKNAADIRGSVPMWSARCRNGERSIIGRLETAMRFGTRERVGL